MQHWDETVNPLMPGGNKKYLNKPAAFNCRFV